MTMDLYTRKALELTANTKAHEKYGTLYWLLDHDKNSDGSTTY